LGAIYHKQLSVAKQLESCSEFVTGARFTHSSGIFAGFGTSDLRASGGGGGASILLYCL